jgi:hypothetical protein
MAFKMDGSPLNQGLNLFRKGRGKEYRQTKKAIKRQIRKTGGATVTAGEGGSYDITGGSGLTRGEGQTGKIRRKTAHELTTRVLAGAPDTASASITKGKSKEVIKRQKLDQPGNQVTTIGRSVKKSKGEGAWSTTKGTVTEGAYNEGTTGATRSYKVDFGADTEGAAAFKKGGEGYDRQGVITSMGGWTDDSELNMKSSAFKMKYSPFNQGYGSPLNWNERSPLNDLNKDGDLVQSTKGDYKDSALPCNDCGDSSPLNQSSPLNDKESCEKKGGKYNAETGGCTTTTKSTKDVELENLAEGETGAGTATTTGSTTESEAKSKSEQNCTPADRTAAYAQCKNRKPGSTEKACTPGKPKCCYGCAKAGSKEELEETKKADVECNDDQKKVKKEGGGYKCVKDESKSQTEFAGDFKDPDTEGGCPEGFKKVTVDGKTKCQKGEKKTDSGIVTDKKEKGGKIKTRCKRGFKLVDGECIKGVKKEKGEVSEKKCVPKDCSGNRTWDADKCRCVKGPKVEKEKKVKDKTCKGNKVWSEEKGRCVGVKKEKTDDTGEGKKRGMKKVCKEWEYVPRGK